MAATAARTVKSATIASTCALQDILLTGLLCCKPESVSRPFLAVSKMAASLASAAETARIESMIGRLLQRGVGVAYGSREQVVAPRVILGKGTRT